MSIRNMMIGGAGATKPDAPTIGTATGGDTSASVTFSAPANNGGSAITGFTVTASPGGATGSGGSSPITVSGLSNGTAYTFTVTATNAVGTSDASSASNSVTPSTPELYAFTTATFTNSSAVGPDGPGIAAARSAVGQPAWTGTYLNMTSPGIQLWTVPKSGNYDIELAGASSVLQHYNSPGPGYGRSAKFTTRYALTYNTVIKILCGQLPANNGGHVTSYSGGTQSSSPGCFNGGGGGTFVTASDDTPIAIAGGGGSVRVAYSFNQTHVDARMDFNTSGNPGGKSPSGEGTSGGGATNWNAGDGSGGAGLTGDAFGPLGGAGTGSIPAKAFINGGRGAIIGNSSPNNPQADGGFGGGGHGGWGGSGGAGGYSGGGTGTNDGAAGYGGGGANFNAGTIQVGPVVYSGAGYVKITKV